jgi:plastocyanin
MTAGAFAQPSAPAATVTIHDDFAPPTLTVKAGQTVRFINKDDEKHTVTANGGLFDSKGISPNHSFSYTFAKPGQYPYHCTIHPNMKGTVVVK